ALVRYAVWFGIAFCLADWVLVQDLGFLGGLGTDPNSMIPMALLFSAGYLALAPAPQEATVPQEAAVPEEAAGVAAAAADIRQAGSGGSPGSGGTPGDSGTLGWRRRLRPRALGTAAANRNADPILALAIAGNSTTLNLPAPGFSLTDQNGQTVSLASLRGKVVL